MTHDILPKQPQRNDVCKWTSSHEWGKFVDFGRVLEPFVGLMYLCKFYEISSRIIWFDALL